MKGKIIVFFKFLCIILFINTHISFAQGLGPQVLPLVPKEMTIYNAFYLNIKGNTSPSNDVISSRGSIQTDIISIPIIHSFSFKGQLARVMVVPTYGWVDGNIDVKDKTYDVFEASGFGDTEVIFWLGLKNTPALTMEEFLKWEPKFQINAMVGVGVPTGKYNQERAVNMGSNRWAFRLGIPMVVPLNKEKVLVARWEINPSLFIYSKNSDNFLNTSKTQNPLFFLEQHVSKQFTPKFWGSVDLNYQYGGKTYINNFENDDLRNQFSTGITLGYSLIDGITAMGSYDRIWFSEDSGNMLRFGLSLTMPSKNDRAYLTSIMM